MNLLQTDQVCTKPACCALSLLLLAGVVGIACAQPSSTTLTIGDAVECLAISPDGKTLAVGVRGFGNAPDVVGRIQFWDLTSNEPAATISARRGDLHSGHQGSASSLAFSPDGATLVSGGWDGSIRIWDLAAGRAKPVSWGGEMGSRSVSENGRPYGAVLGGAEEMALSPDGTKLAAYAGERVGVWDSQNPKRVAGYPQFPLLWNQTSSTVGDLAFSPDGRFLAIGIGDPYRCGVHIVEAASGRRLRTFERDQPTYAVAFSPDGNTLAWTGTGKAITLWDLTKGDQASPFSSAGVSKTLQPPSSKVFDLAFSPDGKTLAAGGEKGRLTLWNVDDGTLKAALEGHTAEVRFVAFSPNGAILASGSGDHTIRLWRLATEDARPADATEHHLIQGAWRVVSIVRDGKPAAPTTVTTYAFDDTSVTIQTADNSPVLASYKINPTFRPGRLDIVHETQGKSQVSEMVYSLQGDALTLCYAKQGQPRPTSLDSAPSDQRTVLVLKRAPEAASAATGGERQAKNTDDSPPPRKPSPEVDETAFQSLFNGADLAGWRAITLQGEPTSDETWTVRDEAIVCRSAVAGCLMTAREYSDFVLELEFQLAERANSGVLIGYSGLGDPLKAGMEIQIIDEERLKSRALPAKRRTGAIYDAVGPATPAPLRPLQEWNTLRVRCEGDAVEVAINGSKTVSVNLREHEKLRHVSHSGRIGFLNWQGEAQGVAFRKIRLRKLGQPSASPPQTPPSQRTPSEPQPDPTAGTQNRRRADEANKRGNAWAEQDEFDKAIADCRLGLQNQPDNVLMRQLLAGLTTPAGPAGPGESAVSRSCPIRGRLPHQETGSHRQKAPAESD